VRLRSTRVLAACLALIAAVPVTAACTARGAEAGPARTTKTMPSFSTEAELKTWLKAHVPVVREAAAADAAATDGAAADAPMEAAAPAPKLQAREAGADDEGITNNQVAGVDEGGIVKVSGEHLVILRRGRLFTVSTAGGGLKPVDSIEAYPPGVDARADWYDEMLFAKNMVVVIGYSYRRGGTEINRFRIGRDGRLSFLDSYHLRSDDYYSDRNYASRLVGDKLVVYSPVYLNHSRPFDSLPAVARWRPGEAKAAFNPIAGPSQIYVPAPLRYSREREPVEAMHNVSRCDLLAEEMTCQGTTVLGPAGRTFYVGQDAVYVWVGSSWGGERGSAYLYRMPLDGSAPTALGVRGQPIDQFSFNSRADGKTLDVMVATTGGDAMWSSAYAGGKPALLTLPLDLFGDGSRSADERRYRPLPGGEDQHIARDRFVGDHLLYGLQRWDGHGQSSRLVVAPVEGGDPVVFDMPEGVDRIEVVGRDALVVGSRQGTSFVTVMFDRGRPALGSRYVQPGTGEAESRSHGFFYKPDAGGPDSGLLGLPVLRSDAARFGAEMLFLKRVNRELSEFGGLAAAGMSGRMDDGCVASCVDWYGNARPIFLRGRVFALMGYELVEGDASGGRIREVRRVDFTPRPRARS